MVLSEPNGSAVPRSFALNFNRAIQYPENGYI
jgi:hypothetical protein